MHAERTWFGYRCILPVNGELVCFISGAYDTHEDIPMFLWRCCRPASVSVAGPEDVMTLEGRSIDVSWHTQQWPEVTAGNSEWPDRGDRTHKHTQWEREPVNTRHLKKPDHGKHPLHPKHLRKLSSFRNRIRSRLFLWLVGCKIQKLLITYIRFFFLFSVLLKWAFVWSASYSILTHLYYSSSSVYSIKLWYSLL